MTNLQSTRDLRHQYTFEIQEITFYGWPRLFSRYPDRLSDVGCSRETSQAFTARLKVFVLERIGCTAAGLLVEGTDNQTVTKKYVELFTTMQLFKPLKDVLAKTFLIADLERTYMPKHF